MEYNFNALSDYFKDSDEIKGLTKGNSMYPLFRNEKDIVTVKKLVSTPKINDVLLYKKIDGEGLVLHRLIKFSKDGFVMRGDNLYKNETDVTADSVIGVMTAFERNGKPYDCKTSKTYKMYVIYIRCSYPIRKIINRLKNFFKRVKRRLKRMTAK